MTDELNIEDPRALISYLRESGRIGPDEEPVVRKLPGGVSNRTVLVERSDGEAWVLKQALEKLRVPVDWFSSPERVHREALGLRWLRELTEPGTIPELVFEDSCHHLIGMVAVPQPHENWKTALLEGRVKSSHVESFGRLLATIHGESHRRRREIAALFADRSFFESLRLEPYYGFAAGQVPAARDFLCELIAATRARSLTLVHGDYSPKNVLIREDRLVLLDHEVIHFGDPAFDIGFGLTHFLSKAHHLPAHRAAFRVAAESFWGEYRAKLPPADWSADLDLHAVRHTLACLLARVDGRSALEYLDGAERTRQREAVLALVDRMPETILDLIDRFVSQVSRHADD